MADVIIRCGWPRLKIIIDDIELGAVIAAIDGTMNPIKYHIIYKIKNTIPANRGITAGIVCPKIAHECTVLSSQRASKGMIPCIQCFSKNGVLYSDINRAKFLFYRTRTVVVHVPIHTHILIKSPTG